MARALRTIAALSLAMFVMAVMARAQTLFEKLVMPGDVVQSHAKLEKTCESCHEPFSKTSQRRLCLDCHKEIATDIGNKLGFHGKRPEPAVAECKTCHTDHKGRSENIAPFDAATFNHTFTGFGLKGRHVTAPCSGCHQKGEKFRKAAPACVACHKKDDAHKGSLGTECASCHSETAWSQQKPFDHSKTKFSLEGAHKAVKCAVCHIGERYKDLPHACIDCHKIQDIHGGRYGQKCETCHAPKKWKTISFDHAKATLFPLKGAHEKVKCDGCHKGDFFADKLPMTCVTCHKSNDPHNGQLGQRCESCHNETNWRQKVVFDHDLTKFPLIGLHAVVPCENCHRTQAYQDTAKTCSACHNDTAHKGTLGTNCQRCHNPNGWQLWRFDHDKETKFQLTGSHAGLQCSACHKTPAASKVSAPKDCFSCHSGDDAHRGTFGRNCETCHTTETFRQGQRRP